jgi:DNA-binding NarL/FixJ family response regulator
LVWEDTESDHAEVAVVDDVATVKSLPRGTPAVLLSGRGSAAITHGSVAATLGADADPVLIAAAARLAAAGYRITGLTLSASTRLSDEVANDPEETVASLPIHLPIHLSPREAEVLALLAEGAPNKVIARRLGISVHTVKFHVAALLVKLGAANRTDAIATAMRQGLVLV